MAYYNVPLGTQKQNQSASQINANFDQANTSFGIDHYPFSDLTANNGFHNQVTTPAQASNPTTTTNPILYAKSASSNLGVLQYTIPPSSPGQATPTPLTAWQSSAAAVSVSSGGITILDFTGINIAMAEFFAFNAGGTQKCQYTIYYGGGTFNTTLISGSVLTLGGSGTLLTLVGSSSTLNVYWTLRFLRLQ